MTPDPDAGAVANSLGASITMAGLAPVYKQQGNLKERLQLRRAVAAHGATTPDAELVASPCSKSSPSTHTDNFCLAGAAAALVDATTALESVSRSCFEAWCTEAGVPAEVALGQFGDLAYTPAGAGGSGKGKSVLNIYHYYNEEACDEEPCREHADPGLLTLLCRSTNAALQVRLPLSGEAPAQVVAYEDMWRDVEPAMDAAVHAAPSPSCCEESDGSGFVLLAIVGETLERLSGKRLAACQHRVARAAGTRLNMAYEMRPRINVWHPLESVSAEVAPE